MYALTNINENEELNNNIKMNTIHIVNETLTNGYRSEVLDLFSLISIFCGIFVIISKNPIISVLFLIGLFLSVASYLLILGMSFIGLSYLLVYVGAVSILFLFILMLINVRISELLSETKNRIPLVIIIAVCFNYPLYQALPHSLAGYNAYAVNLINIFKYILFKNNYSDYLYKFINFSGDNGVIAFVTANSWDGNLSETSHITSIGNIMYTSYSI